MFIFITIMFTYLFLGVALEELLEILQKNSSKAKTTLPVIEEIPRKKMQDNRKRA